MSVQYATIERNVQDVRKRIAAAAARVGRAPDSVRLIPVTKSVEVPEIRVLFELGLEEVGENRVDAARLKREQLSDLPLRWHMVGNLQRRKVRDALEVFDVLDAVDRMILAETIATRGMETGRVLPVLLEVNVSGESSKHGFAPGELEGTCSALTALEHLRVEGLMTMAPLVDDPEQVRPVFRRLRELGQDLGLRELSMGMTNDFEVAIEEGATQVRIGTALFT